MTGYGKVLYIPSMIALLLISAITQSSSVNALSVGARQSNLETARRPNATS
jgi:hypothetical protein